MQVDLDNLKTDNLKRFINTETRLNLSNELHTKTNLYVAPFSFEREDSFWINYGQEQ